MGGFVKLYGTILTSSVWVESTSTRIVWITLLALADKDGFVSAAVPGLAHIANVSLADCEAALRVLEGPDQHSRTPEHDGRRIERMEGGWLVLNRTKYRDLQTEKQRSDAERQKKHRDASRTSRDVALETEKEKEKEKELTTTDYPPDFELLWRAYPKREGASPKRAALKAYNARLKEGVDFTVMQDGTNRYEAFARVKGWVGTEYVMQPARFYGPDKLFLETWEIAQPKTEMIAVGGIPSDAELRRAGIKLA